MDSSEALTFLRKYFNDLFGRRNVDALDGYLHENYFDGDIGDSQPDHIRNSKEFLTQWFAQNPTIGVEVKDALARDDVISAFLEWSAAEDGVRKPLQKGVAVFVMKDGKIIRRQTYIYWQR
jgi:hypothetical protein